MRDPRRGNGLWLSVMAALGTVDARGQEVPALAEPMRVEVTGSRIARTDAETALPVQVISRDEILRGNFTTAAKLMAYVSANVDGTNNASCAGTLNAPANPSDSRAPTCADSARAVTLVLFNGRRLSNYAFVGSTVDLSKIPLAAIDRSNSQGRRVVDLRYRCDRGRRQLHHAKDQGVECRKAGVTDMAAATYRRRHRGWGDYPDRFNAFVTLMAEGHSCARSAFAPGYRPRGLHARRHVPPISATFNPRPRGARLPHASHSPPVPTRPATFPPRQWNASPARRGSSRHQCSPSVTRTSSTSRPPDVLHTQNARDLSR